MLDALLHWAYGRVDTLSHNPDALDMVRVFLINAYVPAMLALASLTAAAVLIARRPLLARLGAVPLRSWLALFLILNGALALRLFWVPQMPQVYGDEVSFLDTADHMARSGLNELSTVDAPPGDFFHQCPAAWQFLISRCYQVTGVHPGVAFTLAGTISTASVGLLFLVLFEMSGGRARVGLWGALFLAVLPVHLRLSGSSALETPSLFFLLATLYALHVWSASGERSALVLAGCLFGWFANIRMENSFALGPLLLAYVLVVRPGRPTDRTGLVVAAAIGAFFSLPAMLADFYGVATHFYFFYQPPEVTQAQIESNWAGNFPYWFDDGFHPLLVTLLALVGLAAAFLRRSARRVTLFWAVWTLALVIFYTLNPSCDFALHHTLDSWRTALHPALGLLVLAAFGADALVGVLGSRPARGVTTAALLLLACLVPFSFRDFIQGRHLWMRQWEAMVAMRSHLPPDAFLLIYDHSTALSPQSPGLAYEVAATTGVAPHFFIFPDNLDPAREKPQIVRDVQAWKVEKRKLFLYHLDAGTVQDAHDLSVMQDLFHLQPVAGTSLRLNHACFSLWRIEPSDPPAWWPVPERKALR
jgi:hypothetical protein